MNMSKRIILEYLNSPVALFDYENTLTDCNAIFLKVFPEVTNYHDFPITLEHFQKISNLDLTQKTENGIILKEHKIDDNIAKYHCHLNDFHDESGNFLGNILVLNDITKEFMALEKAEQTTKAKSAFLSSMSHEIRTPINAVLGMDELILRECEDPQILEYATSISNAGKLLLSIINDILDISKMESGSMNIVPTEYKTADMINSLHAIIDLRAKNKGLDLVFDISSTLPSVLYGDEMRIQQCITNFLTNAVKYTPSGQVTLTMNEKQLSDDEILLQISVKDSGIGIKEEDLHKLFKSFQRLDETKNRNIEGTGLGLHLTHNLIQLMGGNINVTSEYGKGSTFFFAIKQKVIDKTPVNPEKTTTSNPTKYEASFTAQNANILVVDDNRVNLAVLKGLLKNTLCNIDTVNSGTHALKKVTQTSYDIIFLDHLMPEMDGIQTLCEMKRLPDNLSETASVIALTANVYSGANQFYKEAGFTDYLSKPVDAKLLEEIMIKYLKPELVTLSGNNKEQGLM